MRSPRGSLTGLLVILLLMGPICGTASAWPWVGTTEIGSGTDNGRAVAFSNDGRILVSAHGRHVMVLDATSREEIHQFTVNYAVEAFAFSSNDTRLVIGMESRHTSTPAAVVYEIDEGIFTRARHTEDGQYVDRVSIAPDDAAFAIANEDGGITEWRMNEGTGDALGVDRSYPTTHAGAITCLDHSLDGAHLLSGAEDGAVILWNRSDQTQLKRWNLTAAVDDCTFSHDGSFMTWMSNGVLFLRNHDATFSFRGEGEVAQRASRMALTADDLSLATLIPIHLPDEHRHIQFHTLGEFGEVTEGHRVQTGHHSLDFALHPTENLVAVATDTPLVAFYGEDVVHPDVMGGGIDTDADGIPDTQDLDDDGDGIVDEFDNICLAGNNCALHPDPDMMRRLRFTVDGTDVTIRETIHLTSAQSHELRVLFAEALSVNQNLDGEEVRIGQALLCAEWDPVEIQDRWAAAVSIEGQPFRPASATCQVDSGLEGTDSGDRSTRIGISWITEGWIEAEVSAPYNVSIEPGVQMPSMSIALNVHTHPIHVIVDDDTGSSAVEEDWGRHDPALMLLVSASPTPQPDAFQQALSALESYWIGVLVCVITLVGLMPVVIFRRRYSIDFDLDEEGDSEEHAETDHRDAESAWEHEIEAAADWGAHDMEEAQPKRGQPRPPAAVRRDLRRTPTPPAAVQQDLATHDAPRKRKVRREAETVSNEDVDLSQIMEEMAPEPTSETPEEESEEMDDALALLAAKSEEIEKKRRRPVRRKKSS